MHIRFDSRVALVAGAGQGLGQAIATQLAMAGARVHVADINEIAWIRTAGDNLKLTSHRADLAQRPSAQALVEKVVAAEGRLDVLVNATGGVCGQAGGPIEDVTEEAWQAIFRANVDSAFWLAQAAAPHMRKAGYGRLVLIASGAGLRPSLTGIQAYTAAKHAVVGLARQLSQDLGPFGITSNAVAPGLVRSNPSTEKQWAAYGPELQKRLIEGLHTRRPGKPEDIAAATLFLASEQAGWITGQVLSVDGGRS